MKDESLLEVSSLEPQNIVEPSNYLFSLHKRHENVEGSSLVK